MKIEIIAIGKVKDKHISALISEYQRRLPWKVKISEYWSKQRDEIAAKEDEGKIILSKIPDSDFVIALEEKGKDLNSIEFAEYMQKLQLKGYSSNIKFVIGGAAGISEKLRKRADFIISLGKMTYPHQLARILLIEQLYRAWTIAENRSYHK